MPSWTSSMMVRTWRVVTVAAGHGGGDTGNFRPEPLPQSSAQKGPRHLPTPAKPDGAASYLPGWAVRSGKRSTGWPGCREGKGGLSVQGCRHGTRSPGGGAAGKAWGEGSEVPANQREITAENTWQSLATTGSKGTGQVGRMEERGHPKRGPRGALWLTSILQGEAE